MYTLWYSLGYCELGYCELGYRELGCCERGHCEQKRLPLVGLIVIYLQLGNVDNRLCCPHVEHALMQDIQTAYRP